MTIFFEVRIYIRYNIIVFFLYALLGKGYEDKWDKYFGTNHVQSVYNSKFLRSKCLSLLDIAKTDEMRHWASKRKYTFMAW